MIMSVIILESQTAGKSKNPPKINISNSWTMHFQCYSHVCAFLIIVCEENSQYGQKCTGSGMISVNVNLYITVPYIPTETPVGFKIKVAICNH